MKKITLGKTGLIVSKPGLGCLPIQRRDTSEAVRILRRAFDAGINFYDTANGYTDSEEKIGIAFKGLRGDIIIATKSGGLDKKTVAAHIELSLRRLQTDYLDIFQFHNTPRLLDYDDPDSPWAAAFEAKKKGYILHIGASAHKLPVANKLVDDGIIETMQFPFSYISTAEETALVEKCAGADVGFIAMKGIAGGLLTNPRACHAFLAQYENAVPIWGVQYMHELEQWLQFAKDEPELDDELRAIIEKDRQDLSGDFCRSCGYCLPCPAGIEIPNLARFNKLIRRAPWQEFYSDAWRAKVAKIDECTGCGHCAEHCPYGLNPTELMKANQKDYHEYEKQVSGT